jgi:hypothetical protein
MDLFLSVASDTCSEITLAGSEKYYAPCDHLTPDNETLEAFIGELRCRIGNHPIVLDSGRGYWNVGPCPVSYADTVTRPARHPA